MKTYVVQWKPDNSLSYVKNKAVIPKAYGLTLKVGFLNTYLAQLFIMIYVFYLTLRILLEMYYSTESVMRIMYCHLQ